MFVVFGLCLQWLERWSDSNLSYQLLAKNVAGGKIDPLFNFFQGRTILQFSALQWPVALLVSFGEFAVFLQSRSSSVNQFTLGSFSFLSLTTRWLPRVDVAQNADLTSGATGEAEDQYVSPHFLCFNDEEEEKKNRLVATIKESQSHTNLPQTRHGLYVIVHRSIDRSIY